MKDYKLNLRNLRDSHTLGWSIGTPSRLRLTRKAAAFASSSPHFDFSIEEKAERGKWKYDDPKFDCAD